MGCTFRINEGVLNAMDSISHAFGGGLGLRSRRVSCKGSPLTLLYRGDRNSFIAGGGGGFK